MSGCIGLRVKDLKWTINYTSRGNPTIEIVLELDSGATGRFASPAGASRGRLEAPPYPEGGLTAALKILREFREDVVGREFESQKEFDVYLSEYDGTGNYSRIGSVVSLGCSVAFAEAAAKEDGVPMFLWLSKGTASGYPLPLGNVLGGGKHSRGRSIDIQEILVFPSRISSYREGYDALIEVHKKVGKLLIQRDPGFTGGKNDEGAWTTNLSDEDALSLVSDAVDQVSSELGVKLALGIDAAASTLYDEATNSYFYRRRNRYLDREQQINYMLELIDKFGIKYVEDPVEENDYAGFSIINREAGRRSLIVGDDIFVTNVSRIKLGIEDKAANAVIIKPNQVGDLTKTLDAVMEAGLGGLKIVVSHRSGETVFPHLAHIAIAAGAILFKCGVVGGERIVKHMELMRLEEELGGLKPATFNL